MEIIWQCSVKTLLTFLMLSLLIFLLTFYISVFVNIFINNFSNIISVNTQHYLTKLCKKFDKLCKKKVLYRTAVFNSFIVISVDTHLTLFGKTL